MKFKLSMLHIFCILCWILLGTRMCILFFKHGREHFQTARELRILIHGVCKEKGSEISGRVVSCEDFRTRYERLPNILMYSLEQTSKDMILDTFRGAIHESVHALRALGFIGLAGVTIAYGIVRALKIEPRLPVSFAPEYRSRQFITDAETVPLFRHMHSE